MSKRRIARILGQCFTALLFLTNGARLSAIDPADPLFGTWVNPQYNGNSAFSARFILFPDGRELDYDFVSSAEPAFEGRFTVDETWIDAEGNHWYKTHGSSDFYPYKEAKWKGFSLLKIGAAGTDLEAVGSQVGYPEELSPLGGAYCTYRRQQ